MTHISKKDSFHLYNQYFQHIFELQTQLHPLTHLYNQELQSTLIHFSTYTSNNQLYFFTSIPKLKHIVISHTSKRVFQHHDALIPILYAIQSLTLVPFQSYFQNIFATKSLTIQQLHIQKNSLLGIKVFLKGIYLYQFLHFLHNHRFLLIKNTINNFFDIFDFDQHYDHIVTSFKTLEQFGCRFSFATHSCDSNSLSTLLALYHL